MNSLFARNHIFENSRRDIPIQSNLFCNNPPTRYENLGEPEPEDKNMLKKKTPRKKAKPAKLEEVLEKDKKKKPRKTQNVNISNTNPCIINQNNFYNAYPQQRYVNLPPTNLDIPDPTKFIPDKKGNNMQFNNIMDPGMVMNMQRMPFMYYPGFVMNDYGLQNNNFYKKK
jgi:hypothetical protein